MKKLALLATLALTTLSAFSYANEDPPAEIIECNSDAPAHVAESTVVDHEGDAREEAERRAVDVATARCAEADEGVAVFTDIQTSQSGAVATSTVEFVCSLNC